MKHSKHLITYSMLVTCANQFCPAPEAHKLRNFGYYKFVRQLMAASEIKIHSLKHSTLTQT